MKKIKVVMLKQKITVNDLQAAFDFRIMHYFAHFFKIQYFNPLLSDYKGNTRKH